MAYPATTFSMTATAGTQTLGTVDHNNIHNVAGSAIAAIANTVLGTTSGTSILKNFAVGDFAVRANAGGTLQQSLAGTLNALAGTFNNLSFGTPTLVLGSDATGDMFYRSADGTTNRLGIGTASQILTVSGGLPAWSSPASRTGQIIQVASNYSTAVTMTTSASFSAVTSGTVSIVTAANSRAIVQISANVSNNGAATNRIGLFLTIDGTDTYDTYLATGKVDVNGSGNNASLVYRTAALSAGTHTIILKMNNSDSGTSVVANHSIVVMEESA